MSGLGTEKSDIDMCLLVKPCLDDPRSDALSYLQNIQTVLYNSGKLSFIISFTRGWLSGFRLFSEQQMQYT